MRLVIQKYGTWQNDEWAVLQRRSGFVYSTQQFQFGTLCGKFYFSVKGCLKVQGLFSDMVRVQNLLRTVSSFVCQNGGPTVC